MHAALTHQEGLSTATLVMEASAVCIVRVMDIDVALNEGVLFHVHFASAAKGTKGALETLNAGAVVEVLLLGEEAVHLARAVCMGTGMAATNSFFESKIGAFSVI